MNICRKKIRVERSSVLDDRRRRDLRIQGHYFGGSGGKGLDILGTQALLPLYRGNGRSFIINQHAEERQGGQHDGGQQVIGTPFPSEKGQGNEPYVQDQAG